MSVDPEAVRHVARLARLALEPAEEAALAEDLGKILAYVRQLDELDLDGVEPMERVADRKDALRDDVEAPRMTRAEALRPAPDADDRHFRVPRVID